MVTNKVLLFSSYHSGSHRTWARGYRSYSRRQVDILALPGRFWKWRMHGGAISLAKKLTAAGEDHAAWLVTDMLDLTTLRALAPDHKVRPTVLYMHENQLTYPLPKDPESGPMRRQKGERDLHYAFINYASMLAATEVWFNSRFHYESWFGALPRMLKHFPDENLLSTIETLKDKSRVLPVGIRLPDDSERRPDEGLKPHDEPGLVLWNHRWEFDKNPSLFFETLERLAQEDLHFQVIVCGENFRRRPREFDRARERLGDRIVHWGFAEDGEYRKLLVQSDLVISTANHDYFGVAVAEAIAAGCFPLLPNRLAYPELVPSDFHDRCLYQDARDLSERLRSRLTDLDRTRRWSRELAPHMRRYSWEKVAEHYDRAIDRLLSR